MSLHGKPLTDQVSYDAASGVLVIDGLQVPLLAALTLELRLGPPARDTRKTDDGAAARPTTSIAAHLAASPRTVPEVFDSIIRWSPQESGSLGSIAANGSDSRASDYPFLKYVQLFTATGGCYKGFVQTTPTKQTACDPSWTRDHFNNNSLGPSSGLNTTNWLKNLRTVLEDGYLPQVVVGNVPIALSTPPTFGAFHVNAAPPDSYAVYQEYVRGLAAAAVKAFGIDSVRRWRWTVYTEFNNWDWWQGGNASFMKLYDHTVCGLRQAVGARDNLIVGAHGCLQCEDDHTCVRAGGAPKTGPCLPPSRMGYGPPL